MSETGMTHLEMKINEFNNLLDEMKTATSDAHKALQDLKYERKMIEKIIAGDEVKQKIYDRVDEIVKKELDGIAPTIKEQVSLIYDKVGKEIDKIISICLGKEFSTRRGTEDLRPALAAKLREWLEEIVEDDNESLLQHQTSVG